MAANRFAFGVGVCACVLAGFVSGQAHAQSNNVRISGLSDVAFGTLPMTGADSSVSENVCAFSSTTTKGYHITASGSGSSGAFTMANGAKTLAYEVQWNKLSGQTSGSSLTANVALAGQTSTASQQACNSGPSSSGSLIVIIRGSSIASASSGSYTGTLTLVIGGE